MKTINIVGGIFGTTGYDSHTRNLANALAKITKCRLSTQLCPNWQRMVNDAELEMIQRVPEYDDINLIVATPHNWKLYTGNGMNIGYCVWEGDLCPLSWCEDFNNNDINLIITPSNHTKQAMLNTLEKSDLSKEEKEKIITKIKIIPHGVDRNIFYNMKNDI